MTALQIIDAVAYSYQTSRERIRRHDNRPAECRPRHVAMYLLCRAGYSLPEVGRILGGFNHTTVLHGRDKIRAACRRNPQLAAQLDTLAALCGISPDSAETAATRSLMPDRLPKMSSIEVSCRRMFGVRGEANG